MQPGTFLLVLAITVPISVLCSASHGLKIVGGDEAVPHSMPFMAAIKTIIDYKEVLCGGSLIREGVILTAAQCLNGSTETEVTLGAHNLEQDEDTQIKIKSSDFVIHEDYNGTHNDIALIRLPSPVALSENVAVVNFTTDILNLYTDTLGVVAGWGKPNDTAPHSNVLRRMEATIISFLACDLANIFSLDLSQMCTTGSGGKNICNGDAGSPLLVDGVQVGIASFTSDFGCQVGFPSVYTRITSYLLWLEWNLNV